MWAVKRLDGLKSDIRNLFNFHVSSRKSGKLHLMGSFCSNYIMFELKTYRGVMCHQTEAW